VAARARSNFFTVIGIEKVQVTPLGFYRISGSDSPLSREVKKIDAPLGLGSILTDIGLHQRGARDRPIPMKKLSDQSDSGARLNI
jgi:hypothetical protein